LKIYEGNPTETRKFDVICDFHEIYLVVVVKKGLIYFIELFEIRLIDDRKFDAILSKQYNQFTIQIESIGTSAKVLICPKNCPKFDDFPITDHLPVHVIR